MSPLVRLPLIGLAVMAVPTATHACFGNWEIAIVGAEIMALFGWAAVLGRKIDRGDP